MIYNTVPSTEGCTDVEPELLLVMNEFGATRYAVAEHVMFASSALSGDRISLLTNIDCDVDSPEIVTLS